MNPIHFTSPFTTFRGSMWFRACSLALAGLPAFFLTHCVAPPTFLPPGYDPASAVRLEISSSMTLVAMDGKSGRGLVQYISSPTTILLAPGHHTGVFRLSGQGYSPSEAGLCIMKANLRKGGHYSIWSLAIMKTQMGSGKALVFLDEEGKQKKGFADPLPVWKPKNKAELAVYRQIDNFGRTGKGSLPTLPGQ